jgi:hypothetical protein
MPRCKAPGSGDPPEGWGLQAKRGLFLRSETYFLYAAATKDEGNAADERFSATC